MNRTGSFRSYSRNMLIVYVLLGFALPWITRVAIVPIFGWERVVQFVPESLCGFALVNLLNLFPFFVALLYCQIPEKYASGFLAISAAAVSTIIMHVYLDLSADPQAAIGLAIWPLAITTPAVIVAGAAGAVLSRLQTRSK